MSRKKSKAIRSKALKTFKKKGGILRTREAIAAGIHPRVLYELCADGAIQPLQRGLYTLVDLPQIENPDFVAVAKKVPEGVICLLSALYFHHLTVQIPRWVDLAVHQKYTPPHIQNPPVKFHWFSEKFFRSDVEKYILDHVEIKIYSKEKSIVDCFRLRKKMGIEIGLEALHFYLKQKRPNLRHLLQLAKESRILRILEPYIQAITHDQS